MFIYTPQDLKPALNSTEIKLFLVHNKTNFHFYIEHFKHGNKYLVMII